MLGEIFINNREIGTEYENIAKQYMRENNFAILESNYRCRYGEIDIVAKDLTDGYISFVEVKYRSSNLYGMPYEAVNLKKQKRIINTSNIYIKEHHMSPYGKYRYDVVSIEKDKIEYIKNAFGGLA